MKKAEIKVGSYYRAKVNGRIVTVRVDKINETGPAWHSTSNRSTTSYHVTNLDTGRKTMFRSSVKFRCLAHYEPRVTTAPVE